MTFISSHRRLPSVAGWGCGRTGFPGFAAGLLLLLTAVTVGGAGLGCAPYRAPRLAIDDVAQTEESPSGVVLQFTLNAQNDNEVPLPLREVRYRLELNPGAEWAGRASFSGVRSPEATLRANGVQQIVLPAALSLGEGEPRPEGLVPYRFSATLVYVTPGAFAETLFDTGVRRPRASFSHAGFIDFGTGAEGTVPAIPPTVDPAAVDQGR